MLLGLYKKLKKYILIGNYGIPYRTSYYSNNSGICLSKGEFNRVRKIKKLRLVIRSNFIKGKMYFGESVVNGTSNHEILITTYLCHPGLVNDNLSGVGSLIFLLNESRKFKLRYSLRFLIIPETIGAISIINDSPPKNIIFGFVLHCMSSNGNIHFKMSNSPYSLLNYLVDDSFGEKIKKIKFSPFGSDERQFSDPALNYDFGSFSRTPPALFKYYHTSNDSLKIIVKRSIMKSI